MDIFDSHGRLLPFAGERVYSTHDRRYFSLDQPEIDFATIHARVTEFLKESYPDGLLSGNEFKDRCEALRSTILADEKSRHIFNGVHTPFLLPSLSEEIDLGKELDSILLEAAGRSFTAKFPKFEFRNHVAGQLAGNISVMPGVRYEKLLEARKKGPVVGWYFPSCMAGFAIPDQRTLIQRLPESMILSGPLEASAAFVGTPELLMKTDNYPNLLAMAAVRPAKDHLFCFFEAYGWNLTFNQRSMIGAVSEYYAGGLTLLA